LNIEDYSRDIAKLMKVFKEIEDSEEMNVQLVETRF
jgi:hypothetical protein